MPKAAKSSASSGTRKKHAKKAAGHIPEGPAVPQKHKSKPSKKEIKKGLAPPPKKSYIPPSKLKPAPVQVDPLDSQGLAALLPPELVVVLRRLAKKDAITKRRALEELTTWVSKAKEETRQVEMGSGQVEVDVNVLVTILPVWLYRYPALSVHPSRRIRYLSALLHASLVDIPTLRTSILAFLRDTGSETQVSQVLGSWCLSTWDADRGVAALSGRSWKGATNIDPGGNIDPSGTESPPKNEDPRLVLDDLTLAQYLPFILTTIMDPSSTYSTLNFSSSTVSGESPASSHLGTPRHGASTPVGARKQIGNETLVALHSRAEEDPESIEDRNARLRVGAMGVLKWILDTYKPTPSLGTPLRWLLSSPAFWTVLHHEAHPSFLHVPDEFRHYEEWEEAPVSVADTVEGFGAGQTTVRRAGWSIVHTLAGGQDLRWNNHISAQGLIASAILRSAFVEPDSVVRSSMWGPLLVFLTKVHSPWLQNMEFERLASVEDAPFQNEDGGDSDSTTSDHEMKPGKPNVDPILKPAGQSSFTSAAYAEFLSFLALGCNGSPIQGYPTVLVILSTIPREILPPTLVALSGFFDALWAAIDGQALSTLATERAKGTEAFLGAWGECLVWTVGRLIKGADAISETADHPHAADLQYQTDVGEETPASVSRALVSAQFGRVVEDLGKGLRVAASVAGRKVASVLIKTKVVASDLFNEAWAHISRFTRATITGSEDQARGEYALDFLPALHQHLPSEGSLKRELEALVGAIANEIVQRCLDPNDGRTLQAGESPDTDGSHPEQLMRDAKVVERLFENFGEVLEREAEFVQHLDTLLVTKLSSLLSPPSLILSYLTRRSDTQCTLRVWRLVLSTLGSSPDIDLDTRVRVLRVFLDQVPRDGKAAWAKPQGGELDGLAGYVLAAALDGDATSLNLAEDLLKTPGPFLIGSVVETLISTILSTIHSSAQPLLRVPSVSLRALRSALSLVLELEQHASSSSLRLTITPTDIIPTIFMLAFILPHCSPSEEELIVSGSAKRIWEAWRGHSEGDARATVSDKIKQLLKSLLMDTSVRPRPVGILHALSHVSSQVEIRPIDVIPSQSEFVTLLSSTSTDPIDSTLAIIEPLAPPWSDTRTASRSSWNRSFDNAGFSPYARGMSALLYVLTADRQIARENMWALHHALVLALFASEVLQVPAAESPVFNWNYKIHEVELKEITRQTQQMAAFLLSSPGDEAWHRDVVDVLSGKAPSGNLDTMGEFVKLVFEQSQILDSVRDSLILHTVLQYVLRSATKTDADMWIDLARSIGDKALQTSLAISLAVTEFAPEPPKLDRYRNELASTLSGISPSKANTTGLRLLRRLSAVTPSVDSAVIFLPQQRAVFLVQSLQAWVGSDEDLDESVESEVTLLLFSLAPILQTVQGVHWEFIMDLIESNLENSSFKDAATLVILSRTLRLLTLVQDLAASNKYLRDLWGQRSKDTLILVRDLLAVKADHDVRSVPRAMCREQALSIIQDLPGSLMDENTLSTMCHLVTDPSIDVQKMAHQLLQQAAIRRTDYLVVEAGVDSEVGAAIKLPQELIALLQNTINFDTNGDGVGMDPLAYLLGWMITFDLFIDASLKVKTAYVDELRNLDLIGSYFLPNIFEILGVGGDGQRPFKLDAWAVDEYWISFFDADIPQSPKLLAAHLYYRALLTVPSLIRNWWIELKDRQLLTAITSFTSSYFSPVLITSELAHVKPSSSAQPPVAGDESLTDELFNVKVALAINEVTATFNVDDQQMEIGVRLPAEYPLRAVEVREIRRVGVPENLWRKWLFAVQQVVTSQNGRIVDGLGLFKKNVSLHFEGQVECAICYSIISVVDRSLPAKPCKTCKNRFHSSCLYKWFNSSHSSSCPLCRSDIM